MLFTEPHARRRDICTPVLSLCRSSVLAVNFPIPLLQTQHGFLLRSHKPYRLPLTLSSGLSALRTLRLRYQTLHIQFYPSARSRFPGRLLSNLPLYCCGLLLCIPQKCHWRRRWFWTSTSQLPQASLHPDPTRCRHLPVRSHPSSLLYTSPTQRDS